MAITMAITIAIVEVVTGTCLCTGEAIAESRSSEHAISDSYYFVHWTPSSRLTFAVCVAPFHLILRNHLRNYIQTKPFPFPFFPISPLLATSSHCESGNCSAFQASIALLSIAVVASAFGFAFFVTSAILCRHIFFVIGGVSAALAVLFGVVGTISWSAYQSSVTDNGNYFYGSGIALAIIAIVFNFVAFICTLVAYGQSMWELPPTPTVVTQVYKYTSPPPAYTSPSWQQWGSMTQTSQIQVPKVLQQSIV